MRCVQISVIDYNKWALFISTRCHLASNRCTFARNNCYCNCRELLGNNTHRHAMANEHTGDKRPLGAIVRWANIFIVQFARTLHIGKERIFWMQWRTIWQRRAHTHHICRGALIIRHRFVGYHHACMCVCLIKQACSRMCVCVCVRV